MSVTDAKGSQSYAYSPTTGVLTKLLDSAAGTFSASYDVEGDMTSETYPNGMTATYTRNAAGETVGIEYVKSTHCTEKCTWFSETTVPSIHGETLLRSSTLASDTYTYDAAGRLTQTTETPTGKGCTTRIYAYDEDSNRTSLTTREPGMEGKCATEGGSSETHTYDADDRLIDSGVSYDPLGDIAKLPADDGGGHELASEYYVDGQVQKQSQNGQTNTYTLDPEGRILKTVGEGTTKLTTIDHYDGSGEAVTWKEEGSGKYTRLIPGIEGGLSATQTNGETPILQLHDLQGDVVATAALSETETKLLTTYNSTEFGVPVNGTPPTKYSWLGSAGVSSELSSGALIMGTVSYVPQLGRALQTQPVIPPGAGVKSAEGVPYTSQVSAWSINSATTVAQNGAHEYEMEQQKAAEREAAEKVCTTVASMCQKEDDNFQLGEEESEGGPNEIGVDDPDPGTARCVIASYLEFGLTSNPDEYSLQGTVGYACAGTGELTDLTGLTIKLALCVQQYTYGGKWKNVHCRHETIILSLEPSGDLAITPFVCTPGDTYRTYGHFSGGGDLVWEKENGEDYSEELFCV